MSATPSSSSSAGKGSSSWPPALKAYVNTTFASCTDSNRAAVEAELKGLILAAFNDNKLWEIDWTKTVLKSLSDPMAGKKRKVATLFVPPSSYGVTHPHVQPLEESNRRDKRLKRFDTPLASTSSSPSTSSSSYSHSYQSPHNRALYNNGGYYSNSYSATPEPEVDPNVIDWDKHTVVGTSTKLEKSYLRLTSAPDPSTIRPLPVLRKTLELLKKKWREEANYPWVCDQFKSLRQDLTVQRIKNDFTCSVYEIHARIALEKGELGEFNQCQAQLHGLYRQGLKGHEMEFTAYRILYLIHTRNRSEMNNLLTSLASPPPSNAIAVALSTAAKSDPCVIHALQVRIACSRGDYHKLFQLFLSAPKMGGYLMDHFVGRERVEAMLRICKTYQNQLLPLTFLSTQLALDSPSGVEEFFTEFIGEGPWYSLRTTTEGGEEKLFSCKEVGPKFLEAKGKFLRTGAAAVAAGGQ